jgi:hypothetical protein
VWLHRNALPDFRECLHELKELVGSVMTDETPTKYRIKEANYKNMPVAWKSRLSVSFYFLTWQMWCSFINLIQKKNIQISLFPWMCIYRTEKKLGFSKKHIFFNTKDRMDLVNLGTNLWGLTSYRSEKITGNIVNTEDILAKYIQVEQVKYKGTR